MNDNLNWFLSNNVEAEYRFASFTFSHFIYIILGVAAIVCMAWYVKKCSADRAKKTIKVISIVLLVFYFLRAYMFYRYYENFELLDIAPLHLCIISGFVLPVTVFTRNKLLWNLSYSVLMPGALIAIITPEVTLTRYHAFGWMPLIFFAWHFLVVMIPILQIASGELVPEIRQYPKVTMLLCAYALFIFILNKMLDTNYLYLNGAAKGTVLELFENWLGNPGYIIPMAALVLAASFLMYLPWVKKARQIREAE